jgi:hypothetical protein
MNHLHLFEVKNVNNKIRLGSKGDGGYVIAVLNGGYDCYISAGVGGEESFSRDFIMIYGLNAYNCFAYDATIEQYPYHFTKNITYIRKNVGTFNSESTTNFSILTSKYNDIFLKIDIEGGEYHWLFGQTEEQLKKFKQIVIEYHGLTGDGFGCDYSYKVQCLQKLANTHYIVHAHGNNCGIKVHNFPDVLELTYVRKSEFTKPLSSNRIPFPISGLDYKNNHERPDFVLDYYPFVGR